MPGPRPFELPNGAASDRTEFDLRGLAEKVLGALGKEASLQEINPSDLKIDALIILFAT
jgi:hypothetical protein